MKRILIFIPYLAAAAIVTIIMGVVYVAVQQNYRSGANDPQLQIARDMKDRLERGVSVQRYIDDSISLDKSLGVFATLYDVKAQPIQSSGFLDGKFPRLPAGVFDFATLHGEESVTWQPRPGVRMATVVIHTNTGGVGYIVVGRSLEEVEVREHNLMQSVFICWVIAMGLIAITAFMQLIGDKK